MSNNNSVRPEDVLPDGIDETLMNGKMARKGSIAAFLANLDIIENTDATEQQKQAARNVMEELAPTVVAIGLHKHVIFKNTEAEGMLVNAVETP